MHEESTKTWLPSKGVTLLLKATLPTCVFSRRGLSLHQHAPRSSPYDMGVGSHASCKLAQDRRSQTATRGAHNCPAVTSTPPLSPRPAGERTDRHAGVRLGILPATRYPNPKNPDPDPKYPNPQYPKSNLDSKCYYPKLVWVFRVVAPGTRSTHISLHSVAGWLLACYA
jgi:hypothetical protein